MDKNLCGLAITLVMQLYTEAITRGLCLLDQQELAAARDQFHRAEAAHFIVALLFDAAEAAQDDEAGETDATPIHVKEGSSHLDAPDDEAAAALRLVDSAATGTDLPDAGAVHGVRRAEREFRANPDEANHPVLMNQPPSR